MNENRVDGRTTLSRTATYPGEMYESLGLEKSKLIRYRMTGERRPPKEGEHYLSGAVIQAYRAYMDMRDSHWIAERVVMGDCNRCHGTGKVVVG